MKDKFMSQLPFSCGFNTKKLRLKEGQEVTRGNLVFGVGINNMPWGWTNANKLNKRTYRLWVNMLMRCYDRYFHLDHPTYSDCEVCDSWMLLSNFVRDIQKLEGYDKWTEGKKRYELDKDIKGNGSGIYSLDTCCFVSQADNLRERSARCGNSFQKPKRAVIRVDKNGATKEYPSTYAIRQAGFNQGAVWSCCRGKVNSHKGYKWYYKEDYNRLLKEGGQCV